MYDLKDSNVIRSELAVNSLKNIINDVCIYYGKKPTHVQLLFSGKIPSVCFNNDQNASEGMRNILQSLNLKFDGGLAEKCAVEDWAEYCFLNLAYGPLRPDSHVVLKEMDDIVRDRVHLVGNGPTAADVLVYLFLYDLMVILSLQEKERYVNLCRWFDNVQQDCKLRTRQRELLHFNKIRIFI